MSCNIYLFIYRRSFIVYHNNGTKIYIHHLATLQKTELAPHHLHIYYKCDIMNYLA